MFIGGEFKDFSMIKLFICVNETVIILSLKRLFIFSCCENILLNCSALEVSLDLRYSLGFSERMLPLGCGHLVSI